jgi:hypothetical protein
LLAGETATLAVKATTTGTALWNNDGPCPVVLGYHWFKGSTRLTLAWDLRAHCEWFTALGAAPGRQQVEVVTKR